MELAPLTGLADAIVDLVSTGSTLQAPTTWSRSRRSCDISARLVVNQAALKLKREPIRQLIDALRRGGQRHDASRIRQLDTRAADFEAEFAAPAALVGRDRPRDRGARRRRSSPTCARAATRRCSSTRARFDGVQAASVGRARAGARRAAGRASTPSRRRSATRCEAAAARMRSFHERQLEACGRGWSYRDADGTLLGQKVTPLDRVGIYVPGGKAAYPSIVLMNAIPAQVAGVGEIVMVGARRRGGETQRAGARRRARRRRAPRVHDRRRAGGRRAGLRHRHDSARRQDHRPRQRLRRQRQAARLRPGRHRHDRRAERDPGAGRRHARRPTGWRWTCSARPSTTSWRRASCCVPMPATSRACASEIERLLPGMPRARRDPRIARRPRRADPARGRWKRPARSATASRPSTSRSASRDPQRWEPLLQARRRDLPRRLHQRKPGRLLRRAEPRAAHLGHRALLLAAGRLRLPEAHQPDRGERSAGRRRSARSRPSWRTAKACRRMRARPS